MVVPIGSAIRGGIVVAMTLGGTPTDAVREHVRRILESERIYDQTRLAHAEQLERDGHRIITGGQISGDIWDVRDWRTGELIVEGDDGLVGCDAATTRHDPDGMWFHVDHLAADAAVPEVVTPGVPPSLGMAIADWVGAAGTPPEEIAEFVGWPVEKVREYLDE